MPWVSSIYCCERHSLSVVVCRGMTANTVVSPRLSSMEVAVAPVSSGLSWVRPSVVINETLGCSLWNLWQSSLKPPVVINEILSCHQCHQDSKKKLKPRKSSIEPSTVIHENLESHQWTPRKASMKTLTITDETLESHQWNHWHSSMKPSTVINVNPWQSSIIPSTVINEIQGCDVGKTVAHSGLQKRVNLVFGDETCLMALHLQKDCLTSPTIHAGR